ncbi:MAG TPA: phosphatidate cytidylyltransferase [Actinomycetota bacterium]|nr:phosphatidate cytidylyltransferase [Actinomycetota bacterium]
MPEDEEKTEGEDLFEDLDKFFAPIQDVDWPESSEPTTSQATPARREEPEPEEPKPASETPGETPREGTGGASEPAAADAESEDEDAEEADAFLLEGEGYREEDEVRSGTEYVELPGDESEVAELDENAGAEEPPDIEAVEAAADHFAESVRDEVTVEPEAPNPTEEVAIAELLGDEDATAGEPEAARTVRVGQEGFGGPSWQEPTAIEVGGEPERAGPGRDLPTAFITGIVLAGLAVGAILISPGAFAIFAGIVVLFAQGEFYLAMQKRRYQPATALGLVSGALVLGAGYYRGENAMLAIVALSLFATFLWYMTVPPQHRANLVSNIAITVLGIAYIPLLAAYAIAVLNLPDGEGLALSIIGLTFVYDTAAFGVGYLWGSRPLAPNISPKKSWEGAIGATLVTMAVAVGVVSPLVEPTLGTVGRSVGLAVVVALFAPLGDLAESLIKRDLGIKDMGGILPGHGGVMDRIDSVLFVAPAAFIYLRLILL